MRRPDPSGRRCPVWIERIEPRLLRRLVLIPVGLLEALITVPVAALIGAYEQAVGVWDEVVDLWREP